MQITCIYFNELPSCSLSSFSSSYFFVCPTITVFLMSFTSTIHYVVLLISNKNLPLKKIPIFLGMVLNVMEVVVVVRLSVWFISV